LELREEYSDEPARKEALAPHPSLSRHPPEGRGYCWRDRDETERGAIGAKIESGVMPPHSKVLRNFEAIWSVGAQTILKRIPLKTARNQRTSELGVYRQACESDGSHNFFGAIRRYQLATS
jgi:hypothetical protein